MAESTPLLTPSNSTDSIETLPLPLPSRHHHPVPSSLDETFERYIGDFGWSQLLQALLVSLSWVFDAQQTFISVFTDAEPSWHCTASGAGRCSSSSPPTTVCGLPGDAWAWDRPAEASILSEWSLACAGSLVQSLPASSFFMGCMVGGFALATLADSSLGRKNMLFFSCLLMSASGLLTIFSPNIWVYSGLRFLSGFGRSTIGTCAIVLCTELVGRRFRGQVGVIGFFFFTVGFMSLPAIAYLNRESSWRYLYIWTSVPGLLYCFLIRFLVLESPRWLLIRGRNEEAAATLKSIGAVTSSFTLSFSGLPPLGGEAETEDLSVFSVIRVLLEKRWALQRLSAVMTVGFGVGMVYYGMPLALGNLPFNLYWNVVLNALSELPASLVVFFFIERMKRRRSVMWFIVTSGACSLACVVVGEGWWEWAKIGLELVSFFSTCTAFDVLLIYTIELFPTCVRNSAMGMVRQALVLGGVFCPFIVSMGRGRGKGSGYLSYGVFGAVIISCGLFVGFLPETKGRSLCDTMEEEENKQISGGSGMLA